LLKTPGTGFLTI